jgi:hypothetical protein
LNELLKKEAKQRHLNSQSHKRFPPSVAGEIAEPFEGFIGVSAYAVAQ